MDSRSKSSSVETTRARRRTVKKSTNRGPTRSRSRLIPTDMLPDNILLEIFDFCVREVRIDAIEAWQSLVHVCRRWRNIVFGSPHRLNLRLLFTPRTARDKLAVWPALPLIILGMVPASHKVDDTVAALEHSDRVRIIDLYAPGVQLEKYSAAMQEPFPELTNLILTSIDETVPAIPDSFLSGSAPRLRELWLDRVPFRGLQKLLLSTTHLVDLQLREIPHSGYISPEMIVTCVSMLTSLEILCLGFECPRSIPHPGNRRPPLTRSVLPTLTYFSFKGVSEYLEDLVTRVDTPQLVHLFIAFFNQIVFDTPQLIQFIGRTPGLKALDEARVAFTAHTVGIKLSSETPDYRELDVSILCKQLDWQLSCLEQIFTSSLPPLPTLEDLYIYEYQYALPDGQEEFEVTQWLDVLHPFTAVKNLYLPEQFAPRIVPALRELAGGRTTEVLCTLQNIFVERLQPSGPVQEGIKQFIAVRQSSGHPIAVSFWDRHAN